MWRNITYERFFPEKNAESAKPNALNLADLLKKVDKIITFWFAKVHTRKKLLNFLEKQNGFKWLSYTFAFFCTKWS